MAGLPTKYAKMGFSKGWKAYKSSRSQNTKVYSMAKRRKVRRIGVATTKKRRSYSHSSGSMVSGWIPLSGKEMMLDFGIGAATAPINNFLKPYQEQYLGMFGTYSDEAALAIVGAVAHKYGSGLIKDGGKELFRVAVISAGQQAGSQLIGSTSQGGAPQGNYL